MRAARPLLTILIAICLLAAYHGHSTGSASADQTLSVDPALIQADIKPGQSQTFDLTVRTAEAMKIDVTPQGLGQMPDGGFQILPQDEDASTYTARAYIKVAPKSFSLKAGESKQVKVTIDVPKGIGDGGRYAIVQIQATKKTDDASDANVGVAANIGASVVLTIDGTKQTRQGDITDIRVGAVASGEPLQVTTSFLNTGNYHYGNSPYRMYAAATLQDQAGNAIGTSTSPLTSASVVPTFRRDFVLTVAPGATLTPGRYRLNVEVGLEDGTLLDTDARDIDVSDGAVLGVEQTPSVDGSVSSASGGGGSSNLPLAAGAFLGGCLLAALVVYALSRMRRSAGGQKS